MDSREPEHGKSTIESNCDTSNGIGSMSDAQVASRRASSSFLESLFREQGITDVSFVTDNAKPSATVPRAVFPQSPKDDRGTKNNSRWDSIPRAESIDTIDNWKRNQSRGTTSSLRAGRRRSGSVIALSPMSKVESWLPLQDEKSNVPFTLNSSSGSSTLPHLLHESLLELVKADERLKTPKERIKHIAGICGPLTPVTGPLTQPMRQLSDDNLDIDTDSEHTPMPIPKPEPIRRRSTIDTIPSRASKSSLLMQQRGAFVDSNSVSKSHRQRRRASIDTVPSTKQRSPSKSDHNSQGQQSTSKSRRPRRRTSMDTIPSTKQRSDPMSPWWKLQGDGTDSTQELTPSPTSPQSAATKLLKLANTTIKAPPLNSPPSLLNKASRRSSTGSMSRSSKTSQRPKSPPHELPGTHPSLKRGKSSSKESKRSKSPPHQQPGTPPSLKRDQRCRRHSDSIIDLDMGVSKKLLHLAQISSPVQPVRQRSLDSQESHLSSIKGRSDAVEDLTSDIEIEDDEEAAVEKARLYIERNDDGNSTDLIIQRRDKIDKSSRLRNEHKSPRSKVQFSPKVRFSPLAKKNCAPRVSFSPRRMHSAPVTGLDPRKDDDEEEALLASFRRRMPFSPGSAFSQTTVTTTKTGAITRSRTNAARSSGNRDIIKASLEDFGSQAESLEFNYERGHSSMGSLEKTFNMADLLPPAPSLETPPQTKTKKSGRRTSMPPVAPLLEDTPPKTTKKKRNRRRSVL